MKQIILVLLVFTFISCKKKNQIQKSKDLNTESQSNTESIIEEKDPRKPDTLKITYQEHKNLFDILTILPDSTMASWGWPKNDRIEWVKNIQKNNYAVNSPDYFSNISLIAPNTIRIGVVDGSWILSIYKKATNNYIVITDDIVGDGNDFHAFEYTNGNLSSISMEKLFNGFLKTILADKNDKNCLEFFDDNKIGFEYSFIGTKKIKISNSSLEDNDGCFRGNTLNYEFNSETETFNLTDIEFIKY